MNTNREVGPLPDGTYGYRVDDKPSRDHYANRASALHDANRPQTWTSEGLVPTDRYNDEKLNPVLP